MSMSGYVLPFRETVLVLPVAGQAPYVLLLGMLMGVGFVKTTACVMRAAFKAMGHRMRNEIREDSGIRDESGHPRRPKYT